MNFFNNSETCLFSHEMKKAEGRERETRQNIILRQFEKNRIMRGDDKI